MTGALQVGQFAILDGEVVDRGPGAGVFHGRGPAGDRPELYIVAEGTTPAGEEFAWHVVSALGQLWATLDLSLTGALQRLFREAQLLVRDCNRKSIHEHRVALGLTCFARRGQQAVVAQAGPAAAFHLNGGHLDLILPEGDAAAPLNGRTLIEPWLTRLEFEPGDRLLLISTPGANALDDEIAAGILAQPDERVLAELYHRVSDIPRVTVLLVASSGDGRRRELPAPDDAVIDATPPETRAGPPETYQPSLFVAVPDGPSLAEKARRELVHAAQKAAAPRAAASLAPLDLASAAQRPEPLRLAAGDDTLARLARERMASASAAHASYEASLDRIPVIRSGHATIHPANDPGSLPVRDRRSRSFVRGLVTPEAPPQLEAVNDDIPMVHELAADVQATLPVAPPVNGLAAERGSALHHGGALVRVRGSMGGRWKGNGGLSRTGGHFGHPPTWLVALGGLAVLIALVAWLTLPGMLREESEQRYARLIDEAQQHVAIAQVQQDPAERRRELTAAQALLLEAMDSANADGEAERMSAEVTAALKAMDGVREPKAVVTVGSLAQFGERPVAVARMVVGAEDAYILDGASGQVVALQLATGEHRVVFAEDKAANAARPLALAYLGAADFAGGPVLLIADARRTLWAYGTKSGLRPVPFAAPANLQVTDITAFGRDLYVLDAGQGAIYQFRQGEGGFALQPTRILQNEGLKTARRLTYDGEALVAGDGGTLQRVSGQLSLVLGQGGIDKRLVGAEPLFALASGELAVADPANDRIVVLKRDGTFAGQYRHREFAGMSALAVMEEEIYVFSAGQLRRVTLE